MMAVSTKLTILLLLPIVFILPIIDAILFYFYEVIFIEIADIISVILVFLLVWERLRESLDKKLEYLDDSVFIGLYSVLGNGNLFSTQESIEKAKNELQKHGKFTIIALYPKNLLKDLNGFLQLHNSFYEKLIQLPKIAQEELGIELEEWTLWGFLGFPINYATPSQKEALTYIATAKAIKEKHIQLINEIMTLYQKLIMERKRILDGLEDFLKRNSLRLYPKPVGATYPY